MPAAKNRNEKLVRSFFRKLSAGDLKGVRSLLHEEASWEVTAGSIPGAGTHKGRDAIIDKFLAPIRGLFQPGDPKLEVNNIFAKGALVAAETRGSGRLKNGKEYRNVYAWIMEIKDGKIYAIREYMDSHHIVTVLAD